MAQSPASQKEENARFRTNSGWCYWQCLLGLRPYARGETERHDKGVQCKRARSSLMWEPLIRSPVNQTWQKLLAQHLWSKAFHKGILSPTMLLPRP
ncbi:hypothetical protein CABS03_11851 [Colletotrichum abscissum]|uniref:Uncharacterized protein n=1 Tax=Colletotrichum abscissum TaxID=1671311 RepID=A0A9P9XPF4_9PEZI|nr:hypothetical protein CABS02_02370 [Colletotrichum abscissum]